MWTYLPDMMPLLWPLLLFPVAAMLGLMVFAIIAEIIAEEGRKSQWRRERREHDKRQEASNGFPDS